MMRNKFGCSCSLLFVLTLLNVNKNQEILLTCPSYLRYQRMIIIGMDDEERVAYKDEQYVSTYRVLFGLTSPEY